MDSETKKEEEYAADATVPLRWIPLRDNYWFGGWYAEETLQTALTNVTMDGPKTVYAKWEKKDNPSDRSPYLNYDLHIRFALGYPDGSFG